jgi:hypothetical protein
MRSWQMAVVAFGVLVAGCTSSHLPRNGKVVGGGLLIDWRAPTAGTAILVETVSDRIVVTQSMEAGDAFTFDAAGDNAPLVDSILAGADVRGSRNLSPLAETTRFVLYFVPSDNP